MKKMSMFRLSDEKKNRDRILEIEDSRYLVTPHFLYRVEHTVLIEDPGVDSQIVMEIKKNSEDDNPGLSKFQTRWVDVGEMIYLFWISDTAHSRLFGDQYQVGESDLW